MKKFLATVLGLSLISGLALANESTINKNKKKKKKPAIEMTSTQGDKATPPTTTPPPGNAPSETPVTPAH